MNARTAIWQQRGRDMAKVAAVRRLHDVDLDGLCFQEAALNMPFRSGGLDPVPHVLEMVVDGCGAPAQKHGMQLGDN